MTDALRSDYLFGLYLLLASLFALGVGAKLLQLAIGYVRLYRNRWRTRRMIRRWHEADARRRQAQGWPGDRPDLYGERLVDAIRVRYDGLPAKGRR